MNEQDKQKHREAIHTKYPDWTDNQIETVLETIEVIANILK